MIARTLCAMALLAGAPATAAADAVPVRSGEHPGFTRLVIEYAERPAWRVIAVPDGLRLETTASEIDYDLSRIFDAIPRSRIRAVRHGPGGADLTIELACDCRVNAFEVRRSALAIDVLGRSAVTPASSLVTDSADDPSGEAPREIADTDRIEALVDGPVLFLRGGIAAAGAEDLPPEPPDAIAPAIPAAAPASLIFPLAPDARPQMIDSPAVEMLTRNLAQEIARAATQGLIVRVPATAPGREPTPSPDTAAPIPNVRIETAFDRFLEGGSFENVAVSEIGECADAADYDVSGWGGEEPPAVQIARLRSALVGEFDEPDPRAVADLARLYIYLSFGLEARMLIEAFGQSLPERDHLIRMAEVVESGGPGDAALAAQVSCTGAAALWGLLALPSVPTDRVLDTDSILLAFSGLPAHLRRHLGPGLANRFAEGGEMRAVEVISNAVVRAASKGTPERVLSESHVAPDGHQDEALKELAMGSHPKAAEALLSLIDAHLRRGERVSADLIDGAEILAFEQGGTPVGVDLKVAEIRARLANGDFREAFDALGRAADEGLLPPGELGSVRQAAMIALVRNADDATFVSRLLDAPAIRVAAAAGRALRFEIGNRLLSLGFAREAEQLAEPIENATDRAELRYAARLALALGNPNRAVLLARRASDDETLRILAEGLSVAGRHREAAEAYLGLGDSETSLSEAWRAGDWPDIAERDEGALGSAARAFLEQQSPPDPAAAPSLSGARAAAEASAELRVALNAMLEQVRGPEP